MNSKDARELTNRSKPLVDIENKKHAEKELRSIYSEIEKCAKNGLFHCFWDGRYVKGKEFIIHELRNNGFTFLNKYPFSEIGWEEKKVWKPIAGSEIGKIITSNETHPKGNSSKR